MAKQIRGIPAVLLGVTLSLSGTGYGLEISSATTEIDVLHPFYFVRVYEETRDGQRRSLHTNNHNEGCIYDAMPTSLPGQAPAYARTEIDYEVDYRSQLTIEFDRRFIECLEDAFEGELTITGQIKSSGGVRDLKIPGYWQAGEQQQPVMAQLQSARQIVNTANELVLAFETLERDVSFSLDVILDSDEESSTTCESPPEGIPWRCESESTADWMRTLDSGGHLDDVDIDPALRAANTWFDANEAVVTTLLRRLTDASSTVLGQIAVVQGRDADALGALANNALTTWLPEFRAAARQLAGPDGALTDAQRADLRLGQYHRIANLVGLTDTFYLNSLLGAVVSERCRRAYEETRDTFADSASQTRLVEDCAAEPQFEGATATTIQRTIEDADERARVNFQRLAAQLFAALKDATILPSVDGAIPGDTLILRVVNGANSPANRRELIMQLRVAEFGVKREVIDSALFLRRDVAEPDLDAAQAEADASGQPTSVEASEGANFTPAPGVTLAWTYLPRERDGRKVMRFLQPGMGVNVSFPQFDSTVTTFTPGSGTAPPSTTFSQTDSDIDVAVGLVFSLFNNRLQFSYGKIMTVEKDEEYAAIGFSFVNLIRGARNAEN